MAQGTPQDAPGIWMPFSASSYSEEVDFLYRVIFWTTTGMFFLTEGLLLVFCVIYRRRPGHRPTYTHGNTTAEITWTIIPALMLLGLAIWQIPTWNYIKKTFPKDGEVDERTKKPWSVTTVDILGEQYKWNVRYPGSKAKYKGEFEYTNLSNVHMPFGNAAVFNLRSKDVIHAVFIPHMRVKQDTVPGLRGRLWFKPNRMFLVDLDPSKATDGHKIYVPDPKEYWVEKTPKVQRRVFVYLDDEDPKNLPAAEHFTKGDAFMAKDFAPGGKLYDVKIAVQGHQEKDNVYEVPVVNGVAKKVKILYQGKVTEGQWADCKYAMGIYEIACAELCGLGHYTMRGFLYVEPQVVYDAWIKSEVEDASEPAPAWKFWRD